MAGNRVPGQRLQGIAIRLTGAAVVIAAVGLTAARYDLVPKLTGFMAFVGGGLVAALALVLGLIALVRGRGQGSPGRGGLMAAVLVALGYAGFIVSRPLLAADLPPIHDVTTDLANPPQFEVLPLREDNLAGVGSVENWRRIHAGAYGHIKPVIIARPVAQVTQEAAALAKRQGWTVVVSDPARGHIEATASVSYIRFRDDVVIRITPTPNGTGSRVDMRSVSRIGVSDLGVNAKRISAFLQALQGG
ncbi:MAG: DUF1499 domain-containing protein [Novosphingobium sp.]